VNALIEQKRQELAALCVRFRVGRLELFGSAAAAEDLDDQRSDLDFLVEFLPLQPGEHFDTYFGLRTALEELFRRPIDLVMSRAITNPYFRMSVNRSRTLLYAA
jgi:predicted nucleotidyltransferase